MAKKKWLPYEEFSKVRRRMELRGTLYRLLLIVALSIVWSIFVLAMHPAL